MLKNFISRWQYGIKVRVIDNALVAKIDTAIEPVTVRIALEKITAATMALSAAGGDYELSFQQPGAGNTIAIAKFESREAAEVARCCIACALYRGSRVCTVKRAFTATIGVLSAIVLVGFLIGIYASHRGEQMMKNGGMSLSQMPADLSSLQIPPPPAAAPTPGTVPQAGEPMSADDYLRQ